MDTTSLTNKTINAILTPSCEPVHAAWVDENTTPFATSMAVFHLANGELIMMAPCEVELDPDKYPSLGLSIQKCDSSALQWTRDGKTYSMHPLLDASQLLPFFVSRSEESDPLGEGTVSEIVLISANHSRMLFRHIMPPMTLGIELSRVGQAPNSLFKPTPNGAA
ncbi:MAG TPA: hypothetical protein VFK24_04820 [Gammaproteobacteria bacterium]|nr:hypothetical protein [Gammaproteobacteria bacterium]